MCTSSNGYQRNRYLVLRVYKLTGSRKNDTLVTCSVMRYSTWSTVSHMYYTCTDSIDAVCLVRYILHHEMTTPRHHDMTTSWHYDMTTPRHDDIMASRHHDMATSWHHDTTTWRHHHDTDDTYFRCWRHRRGTRAAFPRLPPRCQSRWRSRLFLQSFPHKFSWNTHKKFGLLLVFNTTLQYTTVHYTTYVVVSPPGVWGIKITITSIPIPIPPKESSLLIEPISRYTGSGGKSTSHEYIILQYFQASHDFTSDTSLLPPYCSAVI